MFTDCAFFAVDVMRSPLTLLLSSYSVPIFESLYCQIKLLL
ncbi:MAG: hypothetical protein V7K53_02625 [Nostoc sp.]